MAIHFAYALLGLGGLLLVLFLSRAFLQRVLQLLRVHRHCSLRLPHRRSRPHIRSLSSSPQAPTRTRSPLRSLRHQPDPTSFSNLSPSHQPALPSYKAPS